MAVEEGCLDLLQQKHAFARIASSIGVEDMAEYCLPTLWSPRAYLRSMVAMVYYGGGGGKKAREAAKPSQLAPSGCGC